ncbi:phage tail tape measure protein [Aggregatibacter actinomycetemcomitans]|uniref:phage tail tape measure protein n=1 Tax=Aggregatibacter actinomycetemcomitans TaxID=714 RepID=UPI00197C9E9A|nr:phage tail tape measure protein [Aggregatibacter actinomycetemcomitans]MBN6064192.1 phage tail tape measure protein [Aggregatibacter actinomycetemcomitans]MBN6081269.1 phage tail tape measure protein [Aggregatibacter actinomycetemcomitans]MBN6084035.1 phage tail tape measure protein [Aggregatibacter actinomycetemcomitans]
MNNLELKVVLGAVDKLTAPLKNVNKQLENLTTKVKGTSTALERLKKQDKTIDAFRRLKNEMNESGKKIAEARQKAKDLADQLRRTENPTKALRQQVEKAHKAAHRMAQAHEQQRKRLNDLRTTLRSGGIDTSKLSESQKKLAGQITKTTTAIERQNAAMKRLKTTQAQNMAYQNRVEQLRGTSDKMRMLGQRSLIAGTAGYATGFVMLKPAMDFEKDFSRTQALLRLDKIKDADKIAALRNQAIELGASTPFTSAQATQGQGYLAMAGFNDQQVIAATPHTLNLALAGGIEDLGRVTDIASDISQGFKIPAERMERVADVLAYTMTTSNTTLETIYESMKYAAPVMTSLGQSFESSAAMTGFLGNVGIKGSMAGTTLRSIGLQLINNKVLRELGIKTKDKKGNQRQIPEILADIKRKTDKMGTGDRSVIIKDIFGKIPVAGAMELISQADGILQNYEDQVKKSAGTAEKIAKIMVDNLQGDIKNMESAREALGVGIYDSISGELRELTQEFTALLRTAEKWTRQNPELTAKIVKWVAAIGGGLAVVGALSMALSFLFYPVARLILGFGKLTGINKLLSTNFKVLGRAMGSTGGAWNKFVLLMKGSVRMLFGVLRPLAFVFSPLGFAIIAVTALIYKYWQPLKSFFWGFWEGLKSGLAPVMEKFKPLGTLFGVIVDWLAKAVKWFTDLLSPVKSTSDELDKAASAGKKFGEWLAAGIDFVTKPLQWLMDSIQWVIDKMPSIEKFAKEYGNRIDNTATMAANMGFSSGGYVGNGGKYQPMGIVHGGEYVITKETTSRLGVPFLNALNYGKNAMLATGLSMSVATAAPIQVDSRPPLSARPMMVQPAAQPMAVNITINAAQGQDERAIARMVAQEMQRIQNQQQARLRSSLRDRE